MKKLFVVIAVFVFFGCTFFNNQEMPDDSYLIPDAPWWVDDSLEPLTDIGKTSDGKSDLDVPMGQWGTLPAWSAPEVEPEEDLSEWILTDDEWQILLEKEER